MKQEAICHYTDTPLTLPRGGHAASRQHYQYPQMTRKNLSVPSKRVETLPLSAGGTTLVAGAALWSPQTGGEPWHQTAGRRPARGARALLLPPMTCVETGPCEESF